MEQWLISHWLQLAGLASALCGILGGLWRFWPGTKAFLGNRLDLETQLYYCQKENKIVTGLLERTEKRLAEAGLLD